MNITITGMIGKRKEKAILQEAAEFFADQLMDPRMVRNLTLDIDNLNNVPQKRYRGTENQVEYFNYPGTTITVGVNGRF